MVWLGEGEGVGGECFENMVGCKVTIVVYDIQSLSRHNGNLSKIGSDGIVLQPLAPSGDVAEQHSRFFPWSAIQSVLLQEQQ